MGSTILGNVTVNGTSVVSTGSAPNASVQVWCTRNGPVNSGSGVSSSGGAVTMAIVNAASVAQSFSVAPIAPLTPRVEYVLTASKEAYTRRRQEDGAANVNGSSSPCAGRGSSSGVCQQQQLPDELWNDAIFLNGAVMTVSGEGVLPEFPIPGKSIHASDGNDAADSFVFPPWSYGFVVFPDADVAICKQ